jgi:hypothetical protein
MRRPRHKLHVSTFPFLAVLLCAMGALILFLLVMDRRAKIVAKHKAQDAIAARQAEMELADAARQAEWEAQREALHQALLAQQAEEQGKARQLEQQIADTAGKLQAKRAEQAALKNATAAEAAKLVQHRTQLAARESGLKDSDQQAKVVTADLKRLNAQVAELESVLEQLKALKRSEHRTYSLVPYHGKRGDTRNPIYVECVSSGLILHPDRTVLEGLDFNAATLREEVERRAGGLERAAKKKNKEADSGPPRGPYVLFLIRPDGIHSYYHALGYLRGFEIDFGYEVVDQDWLLDFSDQVAGAPPWDKTPRTPVATVKPPPVRPAAPLVPQPIAAPGTATGTSGGGSATGVPGTGTGGGPAGGGSSAGATSGVPAAFADSPRGVGSGSAAPGLPAGFADSPHGVRHKTGIPGGTIGVPGMPPVAVSPGVPGGPGIPGSVGTGIPNQSGIPPGSGGPSLVPAIGVPGTPNNVYGPPLASSTLPLVRAGPGLPFGGVPPGSPSIGANLPSGVAPGVGSPSGDSGTPGVGAQSGYSGTPGAASQSGTAGTSGVGAQSGYSGTPGAASQSGTAGTPGVGAQSGYSGTPGAGSTSGSSGTPGARSQPGSGGAPGVGAQPGYRGAPGVGSQSGSSGTPGRPTQSGAAVQPGNPAPATGSALPGSTVPGGSGIPPTVSASSTPPGIPGNAASPSAPLPNEAGPAAPGSKKPFALATGTPGGGDGNWSPPTMVTPLPGDGKSKPRPAVSPGLVLGNRDFAITITCFVDHVTVYPGGKQHWWKNGAAVTEQAVVHNVQELIAGRQRSVRPGEPPYRPMIRFQLAPDGLGSYLHVYPRLEFLQVPMSRENLED